MYKIILGSGSPRRQDLLSRLGLNFEVIKTDTDESYPTDMHLEEVPIFLAKKKMNWFDRKGINADLIVTADTVVVLKNKILNKPTDLDQATEMLLKISGQNHKVVSGVALQYENRVVTFSETTDVRFAELTENQIQFYLKNNEVLDKAGAYGIQDWIGLTAVTCINGSYTNVMGLPTEALFKQLPSKVKHDLFLA